MKTARSRYALAILAPAAAIVLVAGQASSAPAPPAGLAAPPAGQGWTGLSKPLEIIHARGELMAHMEELMVPIDTITLPSQPVRNVEQLRLNAEVVGAMLQAVPHLFPPTTNLYDPKSQAPPTIALPAIWKNFDSFYSLAQSASHLAEEFAAARGDSALRAAGLKLRAGCDACHELYLRKYEPPKFLPSDYEFDFDAAFKPKKK
jgi:cytochrome c556